VVPEDTPPTALDLTARQFLLRQQSGLACTSKCKGVSHLKKQFEGTLLCELAFRVGYAIFSVNVPNLTLEGLSHEIYQDLFLYEA